MTVRGWLMIGGANAAYVLPTERDIACGMTSYGGQLPKASDCLPGDWFVWASAPNQHPMTFVCVDIPL